MAEDTTTTQPIDPYSTLPKLPTMEEAESQALKSSQYTEGATALDTELAQGQTALGQEKEATTLSYKQQRQDAINSFQDALDAINESVKAVGIQVKSGTAQRGLYNASGELSGIGTNVAGQAIQPYTTQIGKLGERQAETLGNITERETLALKGIDSKINALSTSTNQEKMKLKQGIVESIINLSEKNRKAALDAIDEQIDNQLAQDKFTYQQGEDTQKQETEAQKTAFDQQLELAKLQTKAQKLAAKPRQDQLKTRTDLQAKGYKYIATPKELTKLKKQGVPVINVGKDWFVVSDADQLKLKQQKATLAKTLKGKGTGTGYDYIPGTRTKDRQLTPTEAKSFGVPMGTMLSSVIGQNVPEDTTTTDYDNFKNNLNTIIKGRVNYKPNVPKLYQDYLEAQQAIDFDPAAFETIKKDPNAQLFKHLLKVKKTGSSSSDISNPFADD